MRLVPFFTHIRRLAPDEGGASLTELALVAPVLALFVTGIIDLGQGLSERFTLQQAVNRSLELLQAGPLEGDADADDVDYSDLITEAAAAANVPRENVRLRRWLECDNAPQANYSGNCDLGQETARYIELRVDKTFSGRFFLDGYPMVAAAAMRIQ